MKIKLIAKIILLFIIVSISAIAWHFLLGWNSPYYAGIRFVLLITLSASIIIFLKELSSVSTYLQKAF